MWDDRTVKSGITAAQWKAAYSDCAAESGASVPHRQ